MDYLLFKEGHQTIKFTGMFFPIIISNFPPQTSLKNSLTLLSPFEASVSTDVYEEVSEHHLLSLKSTSHGPAIVPISTYWLTSAEAQRKSLIPILSVSYSHLFFDHFCMISKKSLKYKLPHYQSSSLFPSDRIHAFTIKGSRVQATPTVWSCADTETLAVSWILHLQFYI